MAKEETTTTICSGCKQIAHNPAPDGICVACGAPYNEGQAVKTEAQIKEGEAAVPVPESTKAAQN